MKVNTKFLKTYVDTFFGFGGQINLADLVKGNFKMLDTTLSKNQISNIVSGNFEGESFLILVDGHGWGKADLKNYEDTKIAAYTE